MNRPALAILLLLAFWWSAAFAAAQPPASAPDTKPVKAKSERPKPQKSKPAVTQPSEVKPSETKPAEAKPSEAKPIEAKPTAAKPAADERPDACEVKRGPMKIEVSLKGTFEARRMTPVVLHPRQWTALTVLEAVANGARVKRGDLLVALDLQKIDEAIADLQAQVRLAKIELSKGRQELASLEKLTPLDLAAAARNERISREDFDRFMKVFLPTARKQAEFYLQMSADSLAYQREELDQLEKMYKADDLTEQTEEIVLRRARDAVKRAEFSYKMAKLRHEQTMKYELPREEEGAKDSVQRESLTIAQAKALLPLALKRQQLILEKIDLERARAEKRLKDLLADRAAMTVKAPVDGVVYYGKCVDGSWSGNNALDQLDRGTSLSAEKVFLTIVQTRPLRVRAGVPEKDLQYVHVGLAGKVQPTGYPDQKLAAVVSQIAGVPMPAGSFSAELTLKGKDVKPLVPGMSCSVTLPAYVNSKALLVPAAALGTDPLDDEKHFVQLLDKDGKTKKQPVKIGKRTDKDVEILHGLSEGQKVLRDASKAEEEKPEKAKTTKEAPKAKEAPQAKEPERAKQAPKAKKPQKAKTSGKSDGQPDERE